MTSSVLRGLQVLAGAAQAGTGQETNVCDTFNMGVRVGDRVRVTGWGWHVRLMDVGQEVTVTGVTRQGTLLHDSTEVANGRPIRGTCVGILTPAGGYLGNVAR